MLGGLILGVAEAQFSGMVNSDYKDVFSFGLLVVILIFRPRDCLAALLWPKCEGESMTSRAVSSDGFSLKRCILDAIFPAGCADYFRPDCRRGAGRIQL
jgi:hypothetical protein